MRTIYQQLRFKNIPITLVLFSAILFVGCSGYQSVSYYHDGIYREVPLQEAPQQVVNTTAAPQQSGTYYKNYFSEKAAQGIQDNYLFTNPEQYQSPTPEQTSVGNYQAHGSWGDQSDRINVNIMYNRPFGWNWGWGIYDAPFTFGRSSFWGYNYHPWGFTFGHFHNPYYDPYRFGWGYQHLYYGSYWNRWDNRFSYLGNRYYNRNVYRNIPIYSRLNGSRTIARGSSAGRGVRSVHYNSSETTNKTRARSATRANSNSSVQRSGRSSTNQRQQSASTQNQTPRRTSTRRYSSTQNNTATSQPRNNAYESNTSYSDNNSGYRSSSSSSNSSFRRSSPTRSSTRSSSTSRSNSSSRRR